MVKSRSCRPQARTAGDERCRWPFVASVDLSECHFLWLVFILELVQNACRRAGTQRAWGVKGAYSTLSGQACCCCRSIVAVLRSSHTRPFRAPMQIAGRRRRCGVSQGATGWSTSSSLGSFQSLARSRSQRFDARRCKAGRSSLIARDALEQPARRHSPVNARAPLSAPLRTVWRQYRSTIRLTKNEKGAGLFVVWPLSKKRGGPPVSLGKGYGKGAGMTGGCRPLKKRGPVPVLYGGRGRVGAAEAPAPSKKQVWGPHNNGVK